MLIRISAILLLLSALFSGAAAQTCPTKPITMVVPFAAGGPSDTIARIVAQKMSETLGQQVVVENVPGAGGTTGTTRALRAAPDGHTILINDLSLPSGTLLYQNLGYSIDKDLETIGLVNAGPFSFRAGNLAQPICRSWSSLLEARLRNSRSGIPASSRTPIFVGSSSSRRSA